MLIWLIHWLSDALPESSFAVLDDALAKITLRASIAAVASFLVAVIAGGRLIGWLRRRFREPIVCASAEVLRLHRTKESTPTMGGLFLVAGLVAGSLALGDWRNGYLLASLTAAVGLAALGMVDDVMKLRGRGGISATAKLLGQIAVATLPAVWIYLLHRDLPGGLEMFGGRVSLGWGFIPLAVLVIVGSSNAVNLTDGLDGLAGGCLIFATAAIGVLVYVSGHAQWAAYLNVTRVAGAGEVVIVAGAMIGALLGFLWFNCHPAQVFMGDTGSLSLGGLLGVLAVICRQELVLVIVGGVFVVEAVSVILQVASFRWIGRRVFRCAPLHHHFQLLGWAENKIVVRFWIASALCAILGLATLKLSAPSDIVLDEDNRPGTVEHVAARDD